MRVQRQVIPSINKMAKYKFQPRAKRINKAPENKLTWNQSKWSIFIPDIHLIFISQLTTFSYQMTEKFSDRVKTLKSSWTWLAMTPAQFQY